MVKRVFTPEQEFEIVREYQNGRHSTDLAARWDCSINAILSVLRRHDVPIRGYPKAFTKEEIADIVARYGTDEPVLSIAASYGYSQTMTIYRVLRRCNILLHDNNILSPEQEAETLRRLRAGEIITDLATEYDVSLFVIRNALDRNGIKREEKRAKYQLNIHAFDQIDSEAAAYYLGFIYADGNVAVNRLRVELQERDIEALEGLRRFLSSNAPIKHKNVLIPRSGKTTPACSIESHSQLLADRMRAIGIVPRRGNFHLTQAVLPKDLAHHFIRGFMDGDGCLTQSRNNPAIKFYGEADILSWIRLIFHEQIGTNPKLAITQKAGIKELGFCGGRQCRKIIRWLYEDATIWLSRKHRIAILWLENGAGGSHHPIA